LFMPHLHLILFWYSLIHPQYCSKYALPQIHPIVKKTLHFAQHFAN